MAEPGKQTPISKKLYACDVCYRTFTDKNELDNHHKAPPKVLAWECKVCNKSFQRETSFIKHRKLHLPVDKRRFVDEIELAEKCRRSKHEVEDFVYPCDDCLYKSKNDDKIYTCEICNKEFVSKSRYEVHYKNHTTVFTCNCCGVCFTKNSHLIRHYETHKK